MPSLASRARPDDALLARLADWLVVVIAIVLPWSTSATAICIVAWLLALLPTLDQIERCKMGTEHRLLSRCEWDAVGGC
jgi:hypothetical protein